MEHVTKLTVEQSLRISQTILNSLKLLQMDALSLEQFLFEQFQENPVIECLLTSNDGNLNWTSTNHNNMRIDVDWKQQISASSFQYETLEFFLNDQIDRLRITKKRKDICKKIVLLLDDAGYLRHENELFEVEPTELAKCIEILQTLEPPGICARDLRDCLLLQLDRRGLKESLAGELVSFHLDELAQHNYKKLSRVCGRSEQEIVSAVEVILELNPRPAQDFIKKEIVPYIHPDFLVEVVDEQVCIFRNNRSFPEVHLNQYYLKLFEETADENVKQYLKEQIKNAQCLMNDLDKRATTAENCVQIIVDNQKDFFLNSSRQLKPLSLETVAEVAGLHISTISRAVSGKYIEFDRKVYPVKFFFARSVAGQNQKGVSTSQIKDLIKSIINNECKANPISDQGIVEFLHQGGIMISRRAVAKYRAEMNIPSTRQRGVK